jgi:hypothetical protein
VILFSEEVRHNWLNTIKRVPDEDDLLSAVPLVEKALSQQLRDIKVSSFLCREPGLCIEQKTLNESVTSDESLQRL